MNENGIILINAYSELKAGLNQPHRLQYELALRGVKTEIVKNYGYDSGIFGGEIVSKYRGAAFCVFLDKDKYAATLLEKAGVRLFNTAKAIRLCDDKVETFIALSGSGLNLADTIPGALCYDKNAPVSKKIARTAIERLGLPLVVKESYGSLGKGVYLAETEAELLSIMEKVKLKPHLFQKFVSTSRGTDARVIVIGGKVAAAMKRVADNDFRSNLDLGGHGEKIDLPESFRIAAETAAKTLGLDYCGVDILFGENDKPVICEVNSNAFFGGIEKVTGVNVAGLYAEHIIKETGL